MKMITSAMNVSKYVSSQKNGAVTFVFMAMQLTPTVGAVMAEVAVPAVAMVMHVDVDVGVVATMEAVVVEVAKTTKGMMEAMVAMVVMPGIRDVVVIHMLQMVVLMAIGMLMVLMPEYLPNLWK